MYTGKMTPLEYPSTDKQILLWNSYLNSKRFCPIELLINKKNKNFNNLQKIFKTLALDNIQPKIFINTYIDAKKKII